MNKYFFAGALGFLIVFDMTFIIKLVYTLMTGLVPDPGPIFFSLIFGGVVGTGFGLLSQCDI
jgi:hypothetical protein